MEGKMTGAEKLLAGLSFALLVVAIVAKCFMGTADVGVFVMLAFMGILVWLISFVCAFFPADWRMTEKQKSKVENLTEYQNRYRKIMIGLDFVVSVLLSILILCLG